MHVRHGGGGCTGGDNDRRQNVQVLQHVCWGEGEREGPQGGRGASSPAKFKTFPEQAARRIPEFGEY